MCGLICNSAALISMTIGLNAWHGKHPCLGQIIKYIGLRKAGKEKVLKNSDRKIQIASPNVA